MSQPNKAAIIGGGVIGGGWVARFLLNGWDVSIFDPDPKAEEKISAVLENARSALPQLYDKALPREGKLDYCNTLEDAVSGAAWIQESVPERLDLKRDVYEQILEKAPSNAVIGSSTSGFRPTQLCQGLIDTSRIIVAHPYNPVYLLPIVELVATPGTPAALLAEASKILTAIGMKPLRVKREIDGHIGDRLLEALWREALWLVRDDIATTEEIDTVITHGFGLRWAQMGLFETYRIAGGQAGMAHFMAQFGPALQWPWSRLTDVPELDDELIEKIAKQSDAHSGNHSITELEQIRDRNLIGILRVLRDTDWGAGAQINQHEKTLNDKPDVSK